MPSASKAKTESVPRVLALTFVVALFLMLGILINRPSGPAVSFGGSRVYVDVAESAIDRKIGLSGSESLGSNEGMLFIFELPSLHGFWMKDMNYPIDMVWLDEDERIVHVENSVTPESYPDVYYPNLPAKYVLETNAGWIERHQIRVGDIAHIDI